MSLSKFGVELVRAGRVDDVSDGLLAAAAAAAAQGLRATGR